jgi:site-specific DNA-methyltransferase (adenine-specific)
VLDQPSLGSFGAAGAGAPPSTLDSRPSTLPKLVYHDDARKVWLYLGKSLELLDAIAAKYPDGRFDAIFADPPYFLPAGP